MEENVEGSKSVYFEAGRERKLRQCFIMLKYFPMNVNVYSYYSQTKGYIEIAPLILMISVLSSYFVSLAW